MLKLPDVTLVLIETREHELARLALEDCQRKVEFGDVLVFTDRPSMFIRADRRVIVVPDWPDKIGWSRCFWRDVGLYAQTSHTLGIQWDSWVVEPLAWRNDFLEYDYIGAPWWYSDGMNVGNGGFCLRSTTLLRFVRKNLARFPVTTSLDDDLFSRKYRPQLQHWGFEWAPEVVAKDFAFECVRVAPEATFGFHACFNFDYGCEGDEARLLRRARLMHESRYIREGKIWGAFAEKFPEIVSQLQPKEASGHG